MSPEGHCTGCGVPLASDQPYCIQCGQRVGQPLVMPFMPIAGGAEPAPAVVAGRWALPVPMQMATVFMALALGFGLIIGTALSPTLAGTLAGGQTIVMVPPPPDPEPEPAPPAPTGGGGGGGPAAPVAVATTTTTTFPNSSGGGGGGGGKQKQPKQKPTYLSGTVVHANQAAHSYTIVSGGSLYSIHAGSLPMPGTKVRAPVDQLANRTYKEDGKRQNKGQSARETISGTVSFSLDDIPYTSDPLDPATHVQDVYVVSNPGSSIMIRVDPAASANSPAPPAVGTVVTVPVDIVDSAKPPRTLAPGFTAPFSDPAGCPAPATPQPAPPIEPAKTLVQAGAPTEAPDAAPREPDFATIEAVVQRKCADNGRLLLSADDIRESLLDLPPATVAPGIDLGLIRDGQVVTANVEIAESPTAPPGPPLKITGIADDGSARNANDKSLAQGDLK